jgi:phosphate transport system substrate-binding protein
MCFFRKSRVLFLLLLLLGAASCTRNPVPEGELSGFIQIKGSDTMVNAAQSLAEEFMKEYPYVFVSVTGGGSGTGIASLLNKTCDIAIASRDIKPKEIELARGQEVFPREFTTAYDGVIIIVNKENPLNKISIEELHAIYTGKVKNWNKLGGKELKIVVLSRELNSGTYMYFKEKVVQLDKKDSKDEFSPEVLLLSSSQAIVEEVFQNEAAIGYLGMGYASDRIKLLELSHDGKTYFYPSMENVQSKRYPLSRPLFMYTNGEPSGAAKIFIDFTLSPKGQEQFTNNGFVALTQEQKVAP